MNRLITIASKKIEFPDLSTNSVLSCEWVSDTGCKEYSAGSGEDGDVNVVIKSRSCGCVL